MYRIMYKKAGWRGQCKLDDFEYEGDAAHAMKAFHKFIDRCLEGTYILQTTPSFAVDKRLRSSWITVYTHVKKTWYMITYQAGENEEIQRHTISISNGTMRKAMDKADQWYYGKMGKTSFITVHNIDDKRHVCFRDGLSGWHGSNDGPHILAIYTHII